MTGRGLDLDSPAGQVIQPYVTGTAIVEDYGIFSVGGMATSIDASCDPSALAAHTYCSEFRGNTAVGSGGPDATHASKATGSAPKDQAGGVHILHQPQ